MTKAFGTARFVVAFVIMVGVTAWVGCGPDAQATVSGKVTIGGRPLDRGIVIFVNALGTSSAGISGQIHSDGSYDVQIGQSGEVVSGEYNVTIETRMVSAPQPDGAPPAPGKLLIPERYTRIESSGLRYHVRPGTNVIDIALADDEPSDPNETAKAPSAAEGAKEVGEATSGRQTGVKLLAPAAVEEAPQSPGEQPQ